MAETSKKTNQDRAHSHREFKEALARELDEGCHFVPLIGQGLSNRAGVLTPEHNFPYLVYVIWRCIGSTESLGSKTRRWRLSKRGFPPEPGAPKILKALEWLCEIRKERETTTRFKNQNIVKIGVSQMVRDWDKPPPPVEGGQFEKWNSYGDWLGALGLLCRLIDNPDRLRVVEKKAAQNRKIKIYSGTRSIARWIDPETTMSSVWDRRVMDAFNIFSSRGVRPGMAHQMLAHLSRPLSFHTVLTTNPDDLIEQAFKRNHIPLRVFDVRGKHALPGPEQVRAQDSIVRINYRFSEETGFSKEPPEPEDRNRFYRYLFPSFPLKIANRKRPQNIYTPPGRLLVLGFKPGYERTLSLIQSVLERVREARGEVGDYLEMVEAIRNQMKACGGGRVEGERNVFKIERRVAEDFIREVESRFLEEPTPELKRAFNAFRTAYEASDPNKVVSLEELRKLIPAKNGKGRGCRNRLRTRLVALIAQIIAYLKRYGGKDGGRWDEEWSRFHRYSMKELSCEEKKDGDDLDFFDIYIWPGFLANLFVATMSLMRRQRLACAWSVANFKIFWVSESEQDETFLENYFDSDLKDVFRFARTRRPDILLYELYQDATLCVPPGGMAYQFVHMVAPEPPPLGLDSEPKFKRKREDRFESCRQQLLEAIRGESQADPALWPRSESFLIAELPPESEENSPVPKKDSGRLTPGRLLVAYGGRGLSAVVSIAMNDAVRKDPGLEDIWYEMADHATPAALYHNILATIALRTGRINRELVSLSFDKEGSTFSEETARLLHKRLRIASRNWLVVLYARNLPGANGRWDECSSWAAKDYETDFRELLRRLRMLGITVLYMPLRALQARQLPNRLGAESKGGVFQVDHDDSIRKRVLELDQNLKKKALDFHDPGEPEKSEGSNPGWAPMQGLSSRFIFRKLREWIDEGRDFGAEREDFGDTKRDRLKFLHVLTLFRHSRHFSALCSEGPYPCKRRYQHSLGDDNDIARSVHVRRWTEDLYALGLLRRKNGGFAWMHWGLRIYLQRSLENNLFPDGRPLEELLKIEDRAAEKIDIPIRWIGKNRREVRGWKARSHHFLAGWYFRGYLASRHPLPLQECLYHHLQTIRHASDAQLPSYLLEKPKARRRADGYRARLVRISLLGIATTVKLALPTLQFWMDEELGGIFRFSVEEGDLFRSASLPTLMNLFAAALEDQKAARKQLLEFCRWRTREPPPENATTLSNCSTAPTPTRSVN